ncbi:hypothetical protein H5410_031837 [Solanum commersonii]|uniref:DUF4371 domain-containing protein n=1 Tax=Solanum commersonii TaxID=4109 RepID=A0A9J5YI96_SOLCO|nr:hypothetical protein H5410_031837 [Solanum commersonii]
MDKFLIKLPKSKDGQPSSSSNQPFVSSQVNRKVQRHTNSFPLSNMDNMLDFKSLEADPKDRIPISSYGPNIRDANELESRGNAGDSFTRDGFRCWNKALERFKKHVGKVNSIHHKCFNRMQDLINQRQSIQSSFDKQSEKARSDYRMRLNASIDVARFLLTSGFSFRGHDESNSPQNDMMICPTIQKDIVEACAKETSKAIVEDLDGDYFGILVDESKDVFHKEQMALILRYVNKSGMVIERFLGHVDNFFYVLTNILNTIGASFKRRDSLRQYQEDKLEELLKFGEVHTGFAAENLLSKIHEFEFVFMLHLMFKVLLLTNELNKVLQKKDQDIVNAMGLLDLSKKRLQMMREDQWDSMMDEVSLFCGKYGISIPKMNEDYSNGKSKRKRSNISYLHHFRVEVFYAVIDLGLQELNNRFDMVTNDLLLGMASLSPVDSFANFHKDRIMKLAEYYPSEFADKELRELNFQLDDFIVYAQKCDSKFLNLKGIKGLARVMIETKLDQT